MAWLIMTVLSVLDCTFCRYAHVLKTSHAFNILDARGAIGVTERARFFAKMRKSTLFSPFSPMIHEKISIFQWNLSVLWSTLFPCTFHVFWASSHPFFLAILPPFDPHLFPFSTLFKPLLFDSFLSFYNTCLPLHYFGFPLFLPHFPLFSDLPFSTVCSVLSPN